MHSKPRLTAAEPHCLGMSEQARAVLERGQRAFRERQAQLTGKPSQPAAKPAAPQPAPRDYDGEAVKRAIEAAKAERVKREESEARIRLAKRSLLAQVAGVPVDQVHTLRHD